MQFLLLIALPCSASGSLSIVVVSDTLAMQSANSGDIATDILHQLDQQLKPVMNIEYRNVSRKREWKFLQDKRNVCLINKAKSPDREKIGIYSVSPIVLFPSNRFVFNRAHKLPLSLSLLEVVDSHKLLIAIVSGRVYGEPLDSQIRQRKEKLRTLEGLQSAARARDLLVKGRVDGIVEFTSSFLSQMASSQLPTDGYSFHTIKGSKPFLGGYIVCSASATGKQAIALFESAMNEPVLQESILNLHRSVFPTEEMQFLEPELKKQFSRLAR